MRVKYLLIVYSIFMFIQFIFTFEYQNGDDTAVVDQDDEENQLTIDSCE